MKAPETTRRDVLKTLAVAGGAALLPTPVTADEAASIEQAPPSAAARPLIRATTSGAVVETTAGKVRGYTARDIYTFKGIPYAASPEGPGRFMPAAKPKPWAGVRSSLWYGPTPPQGPRTGWKNDEEAFMFEWDDGQPGEDCLRVNVWTPGVNDNKKRPVMVWLHGGGFSNGSGQELKAYEGESLARRGDVVVVSLNHRLNVLGYLDLSAYGQKYALSANAGMTDIVLALEWVRDNIANFGGDPGKVMIFGQSGGGAKVSSLMAIPTAKGLFHRAAVQSGSGMRMVTREVSQKVGAATLTELGLSAAQVDQLQSMPYEKLRVAAEAAMRKVQPDVPDRGVRKAGLSERAGWGSVVDGTFLPVHPFDPAAPALTSSVPMIIGCCLNEQTHGINHPEYEEMGEREVRERVAATYGAKADRIVDAYRKAHPTAKWFDVMSFVSAAQHRFNAVMQAERKAALKAAPAYLYLFAWQTPILDGRPRAFHCSELPFVFNNADRCAAMTGGTPEARVLGERMGDAWINFARSGNPNHSGIPTWPAFSADKGEVMVFDNTCAVKNDPDRAERQVTQA